MSEPNAPETHTDGETKPPGRPEAPRVLIEDTGAVFGGLGLPFYYRHTPARTTGRGLFWVGFLIIFAIFFLNFIWMPYDHDTLMYATRRYVFGYGVCYESFGAGAIAIFNHMFIFAIVLSGIFAPLYSTFSLSNERISGTMEFLRLSPMSTRSVVMGKIFAPAYPLHLLAAALLGVGSVFGLLGGHDAGSIGHALLAILLGCASMNALGGMCAAFTTSFRGSGAVMLLIIFGMVWMIFPMFGYQNPGFNFMVELSPWGAMDSIFWQKFNRRRNYLQPTLFFGSMAYVKYYVATFHILAFWLMLTAASRRLDAPEKSSLPYRHWLALWLLAPLTGVGAVLNQRATSNAFAPTPWAIATIVVSFAGLAIAAACILDHPHDRDTGLADECERLSGRPDERRQRFGRWTHTLFASGLALLTTVTALIFAMLDSNWTSEFLATIVLMVLVPPLLAFFFSLALEAAYVSFASGWGKASSAGLAIAVLIACCLIPFIDMSSTYSRFHTALWAADCRFTDEERAKSQNVTSSLSPGQRSRSWQYDRFLHESAYRPYLAGLATHEDVKRAQTDFQSPMAVYWHYHPRACFAYPALLIAVLLLVIAWRQRSYAALRRTAQEALTRTRSTAPPRRETSQPGKMPAGNSVIADAPGAI